MPTSISTSPPPEVHTSHPLHVCRSVMMMMRKGSSVEERRLFLGTGCIQVQTALLVLLPGYVSMTTRDGGWRLANIRSAPACNYSQVCEYCIHNEITIDSSYGAYSNTECEQYVGMPTIAIKFGIYKCSI